MNRILKINLEQTKLYNRECRKCVSPTNPCERAEKYETNSKMLQRMTQKEFQDYKHYQVSV